MCLFERSADFRPKLTGWRDTSARFLHDLATSGMPMSLASLKASCDAASPDPRANDVRGRPIARSLRAIWPMIGVAEAFCL